MQESQEMWIWSLGQEDPLEEDMEAHSNILAWRIPQMEEPGRLLNLKESDMTKVTKEEVAPNQYVYCVYKKRKLGTDTLRQSLTWRGERRQWSRNQGEEPGTDPSLKSSEGTNPVNNLVLGTQPSELWDHTFVLFKPFSLWYFVCSSIKLNCINCHLLYLGKLWNCIIQTSLQCQEKMLLQKYSFWYNFIYYHIYHIYFPSLEWF